LGLIAAIRVAQCLGKEPQRGEAAPMGSLSRDKFDERAR
jgi:hypothetical protein